LLAFSDKQTIEDPALRSPVVGHDRVGGPATLLLAIASATKHSFAGCQAGNSHGTEATASLVIGGPIRGRFGAGVIVAVRRPLTIPASAMRLFATAGIA
jgi:hypothetical protein